jgi:hypothetical protein
MPLPEDVVQSVASTNFKSLGDGPSFYHNLAMSNSVNQQNLAAQNAIAQQQALGTVLTTAVGKIVKSLTEADAEEAVSLEQDSQRRRRGREDQQPDRRAGLRPDRDQGGADHAAPDGRLVVGSICARAAPPALRGRCPWILVGNAMFNRLLIVGMAIAISLCAGCL